VTVPKADSTLHLAFKISFFCYLTVRLCCTLKSYFHLCGMDFTRLGFFGISSKSNDTNKSSLINNSHLKENFLKSSGTPCMGQTCMRKKKCNAVQQHPLSFFVENLILMCTENTLLTQTEMNAYRESTTLTLHM